MAFVTLDLRNMSMYELFWKFETGSYRNWNLKDWTVAPWPIG